MKQKDRKFAYMKVKASFSEPSRSKPAFTLIETILAITIFAMLAISASQVYTNVSKMNRKIEIQEYVFTEADNAINRIVREVERSTIDYEEYYSHLVRENVNYGEDYGAYGATFYNPGDDGPFEPDWTGGDGACCSTGCDTEYFFTEEDCDDMDTDTYDSNTGQHPYSDSIGDVDDWNAFCEDEGDCSNLEHGFQDELYLIDASGDRKVIFALEDKEGGEEKAVSMVVMEGIDVDGDNISDYWQCSSDYTCTGLSDEGYEIPNPDDLTNEDLYDDDFQPITPNGVDILELSFFVIPFEDPYRAFSEINQDVQQQPQATISMTVTAGESMTSNVLGTDWTVNLNEVGITNVFNVVPSEYKGMWRWE